MDEEYVDNIEIVKKRHLLKKKMIIFIISLFIVGLVIVGIFIIYNYYNKKNVLKYENYQLYQYFSSIRYDYEGVVTIEHDDKITNIKSNGININSGSSPIYFQNVNNEVLFPVNMEMVVPGVKNKQYRLNYFTKMAIEVSGGEESAYIINNNDKKYLEKCFLYDGVDLYFFPYTTTVIIDDNEYLLSPLSYINVEYGGFIEMYDKSNDKYTIIEKNNKDVLGKIDNYTINLSTDMIMYENGNRLLIKSVDKLNLYE